MSQETPTVDQADTQLAPDPVEKIFVDPLPDRLQPWMRGYLHVTRLAAEFGALVGGAVGEVIGGSVRGLAKCGFRLGLLGLAGTGAAWVMGGQKPVSLEQDPQTVALANQYNARAAELDQLFDDLCGQQGTEFNEVLTSNRAYNPLEGNVERTSTYGERLANLAKTGTPLPGTLEDALTLVGNAEEELQAYQAIDPRDVDYSGRTLDCEVGEQRIRKDSKRAHPADLELVIQDNVRVPLEETAEEAQYMAERGFYRAKSTVEDLAEDAVSLAVDTSPWFLPTPRQVKRLVWDGEWYTYPEEATR